MKIKDIQITTFNDFVGELKVSYKRTSLPLTYIKHALDVVKYVRPLYDETMDDREAVKVVYCNPALGVIYVFDASLGSNVSTVVSLVEILRIAVIIKATSMFIIHNHPSGNLNPSPSDIKFTKKLKEASKLLDITLHDSLIITRESYYSCANNDKM